MINLLPPQTKKQIRAARLNVILLRYCVVLIISSVFLVGIFGVGFYITDIDNQAALAKQQESQKDISKYASVKAEAEAFSGNLAIAKTILSSEVIFSKLVTDIASTLPEGVILSNLSLAANTLGSPLSISAKTTSNAKAIELKDKLESSPLFEKVNIANIQVNDINDSASAIDRKYFVSVTLNTVLSKPAVTGVPKP